MKRTLCIILCALAVIGAIPAAGYAESGASHISVQPPEEAAYRYDDSAKNVKIVPVGLDLGDGESASLEWFVTDDATRTEWTSLGIRPYDPQKYSGAVWRYDRFRPGVTLYFRAKVCYYTGNDPAGEEYTSVCAVTVLKQLPPELLAPVTYDSAPGENTGIADFSASFPEYRKQLEYRKLDGDGDPVTDEWTQNYYWDHDLIRSLAPGKYEARTREDDLTEAGGSVCFEIGEAERAFYKLEKKADREYAFEVKYGCADKYRDNTISVVFANNGNVAVSGVTCSLNEGSVCESAYDEDYLVRPRDSNTAILRVKPGAEPGTYMETLYMHVPGDENVYSFDFTVTVAQRTVTVTVIPDDVVKYVELGEPELTYTVSSDFDGFVPELTCTLRRSGGNSIYRIYTIYAENVTLLNARDDEYIKTVVDVRTGEYSIRPIPYLQWYNHIAQDGRTAGQYNTKPVTLRFVDGEKGFDLMSLDLQNWSSTITLNEEGKSEKEYTVYIKNSATGELARCANVSVWFDYVTGDRCEIADQDAVDLYFEVEMRNLLSVQYSIDGARRVDMQKDGTGKLCVPTAAGRHTYTVYLTDVDGREVSYEFDVTSLVWVRLEVFNEDGFPLGYEDHHAVYGEGFVIPKDYLVPYSYRITGWSVRRFRDPAVILSADEIESLQITGMLTLSPILELCIPEGLISYEIPDVLHKFDVDIMRGLITEIDKYRGNPKYYPNLTANERAQLDAYRASLVDSLRAPEFGHKWGEWSVAREESYLEEGLIARACVICGEIEKRTIPKLANPFTDVPDNAWYAAAALYCKGTGKMSGTGEAAFSPNALVTRAMVVTVLWRLAGAPDMDAGPVFTDVPANAWYADAAAWAKGAGVAQGTGVSAFSPEAPVTREQIALMFMKFTANVMCVDVDSVRADVSGYSDAGAIHPWAKDGVSWAVAYGIMSGKEWGRLDPAGLASRAELAQIIYKYMEPFEVISETKGLLEANDIRIVGVEAWYDDRRNPFLAVSIRRIENDLLPLPALTVTARVTDNVSTVITELDNGRANYWSTSGYLLNGVFGVGKTVTVHVTVTIGGKCETFTYELKVRSVSIIPD